MGSFRRRLRRAFKKVVPALVPSPISTAGKAIKVAAGKTTLEEAAKEELLERIAPISATAEALAAIDTELQRLSQELAKKIGGDDAADLMADVTRLSRLAASPERAAALIHGVEKFIETGDLEFLNPAVAIGVSEIETARNLLYDSARPIPSAVLNTLDPAVRPLATGARHMALSEVPGNFSLPALALEHQNPTAITLVDVIVFERIPGNQTHDDLHYWSHELFHVQQYRRYGVADFTRRYLSESLKDENALELAADEYACGFYPCGAAAYLPGGVCRNRPPNCP